MDPELYQNLIIAGGGILAVAVVKVFDLVAKSRAGDRDAPSTPRTSPDECRASHEYLRSALHAAALEIERLRSGVDARLDRALADLEHLRAAVEANRGRLEALKDLVLGAVADHRRDDGSGAHRGPRIDP